MKKLLLSLMLLAAMLVLCSCAPAPAEKPGLDAENAAVVSPIRDVNPDEIAKSFGESFADLQYEDVSNVQYAVVGEEIAQMTFVWNGIGCTARFKKAPGLEDISGMYFVWQNQEDCTVHELTGKVAWDDTGEQSGICLWYDEEKRITYSVSMDTFATREDLLRLASACHNELTVE